MHREIYVNVTPHEKRVAVLDDKKIQEYYVEHPGESNVVGNIYKGRVEAVLPGMGAAFVELGLEKNGFLYVTDVITDASSYEKLLGEQDDEAHEPRDRQKPTKSITEVLKKGDDVLVQVVKEPISTKGARLTTHISIPGRFLVLMPFDTRIGISKRIEDRKERDRIRKILTELNLPKDMGFVARTVAVGATQKDFAREAKHLMRLWQQIKDRARRARPPQLMHQEYDLIIRVVRDVFTNECAKLEIDSRPDFKNIMHFLKLYSPHLRPRVRLYNGRIPLFDKFEVEPHIEKIYSRMVNLKSGGYLVFDETESLVAIDVNSGKFVGKKNLEETAFKTNTEAAEEIARQLKLRDLGGIIIIDFIDMERGDHRKGVFKTLERALESDKAKTNILTISSIGLVEMTRQRMRRSLESKSHQRCPYCSGRGMVKSPSTVSIELLRKLERSLAETRARDLFVYLHPDVAAYVMAPGRDMIQPLEKRFRKRIRVIDDPKSHMEEIKIEPGNV